MSVINNTNGNCQSWCRGIVGEFVLEDYDYESGICPGGVGQKIDGVGRDRMGGGESPYSRCPPTVLGVATSLTKQPSEDDVAQQNQHCCSLLLLLPINQNQFSRTGLQTPPPRVALLSTRSFLSRTLVLLAELYVRPPTSRPSAGNTFLLHDPPPCLRLDVLCPPAIHPHPSSRRRPRCPSSTPEEELLLKMPEKVIKSLDKKVAGPAGGKGGGKQGGGKRGGGGKGGGKGGGNNNKKPPVDQHGPIYESIGVGRGWFTRIRSGVWSCRKHKNSRYTSVNSLDRSS